MNTLVRYIVSMFIIGFIFTIITGCTSIKKEIILDKNNSEKSQVETNVTETTAIQIYPGKSTLEPTGSETTSVQAGLIKLQKAYPDFIERIGDNYLIWKDGTKMIYDTKISYCNYDEMLNDADLEDQMSMAYTKGVNYTNPVLNYDPGRVRNEEFFRKMYGDSEEEARKYLVAVKWLPNTVNMTLYITSVNGVDKKIAAISGELEKLPELAKYIDNPAGSFIVRKVNSAGRLSMHSLGIVIDINNNYSDYWIWNSNSHSHSSQQSIVKYSNNIPLKIVEIFEKYGFIWGGKWYHYETIHFEYRPELLID